jgi:GDP-D-mannose 3',5'-epimerase
METRIVRFHNMHDPPGTYDGGKEKSPAAISRKVALAKDGGEIEVWGDGEQTRSYMYIDDCVQGLIRLMASDFGDALNLGTEELMSVNELVDMVCGIAGKRLGERHDITKPRGVYGKNSDNSRLRNELQWEPSIPLEQGPAVTYRSIESEVRKHGRVRSTGAMEQGNGRIQSWATDFLARDFSFEVFLRTVRRVPTFAFQQSNGIGIQKPSASLKIRRLG